MRGLRRSVAGVAAAGLVLAGGGGPPALASVADEERVYRLDALAHAEAVASAYRFLEEHILLHSTALTTWSGLEPRTLVPGWQASWTARDVRARYCDDTLLVYLHAAELKGVGEDHRSVHAAPHAFVGEGNASRFPALHWLEGNVAKGGKGRRDVPLPGCMTGAPLPSGRAALAGRVIDPLSTGPGPGRQREVVSRETRTEACPSGTHGAGRRYAREITQVEDGRGDAVGAAVVGGWQLVADACRPDYTEWVQFSVPCSATPDGSDTEMFGVEVWRRLRSVSELGESFGPPEIVSSECEANPVSREITPEIRETVDNQSMTVACGQGLTGSVRYTRIVTTRSTKFPWDVSPVVTVRRTSWSLASSSCAPVVEPEDCDADVENCEGTLQCDPDVPGDCGEEGGEQQAEPGTFTFDVDETRTRPCSASNPALTGTYVQTRTVRYRYTLYADGTRSQPEVIGTGVWWMSQDGCVRDPLPPDQDRGTPTGVAPGSPGSGVCGPPGDGSASPGEGQCTGVDASIAAAVAAASGNGDGGSSGGGCYFTTAVVEQRGDEPDDGPTLTALREFRDSYMMETPLRRAMVRAYYLIAPLVVRDLPADDPSWKPMGEHIDRSVELIREGKLEAAFRAYVTGSSRLMLRWWLLKAGKVVS